MNRLIQIAMALLLVLTWGWAWRDFVEHRAEHVDEERRLGAAVVGASKGELLRLCRGGRFDPEEFPLALDEMRVRLGAERVSLSAAGVVFLESKDPEAASADSDLPSLFRSAFVPLAPRGRGRGLDSARLREMPKAALELEIVLPTAQLEAKLLGDRKRFLFMGGAASLVLLGLLWLLHQRVRAVELQAELETSRQQLERAELLKRLGAGLAHETRNPLGVVRGHAQRIATAAAGDAALRGVATTIMEETDRTLARLDEFLLLSRPHELRREAFGLAELVHDVAELVEPDLAARDVTLEVVPFTFTVDADRDQIRRLMLNLILNALAFAPEVTHVRIRFDAKQRVLRVEDDGPGVAAALRGSLFEPYVSGREGGTGLGLAVCRQIAVAHGWQLELVETPLGGAAFALEVRR